MTVRGNHAAGLIKKTYAVEVPIPYESSDPESSEVHEVTER